MNKLLAIGMVMVFTTMVAAQSNIAIGEWKSYLPYQSGVRLTESPDKVIYATKEAIMTIDKTNDEYNFLSKVEGLSDVGIQEIEYDLIHNQLIIAYTNSNIDIVDGNDVINRSDIKNNLNFPDRSINDIIIKDEKWAYLATAFGIVQFDLINYEFGFTTITDVEVNALSYNDNYIFAATDDGLYRGEVTSGINLGDFGNWEIMGEGTGLPSLSLITDTEWFDGKLYVSVDTILYSSEDNLTFDSIATTPTGFDPVYLTSGHQYLMWGSKDPFVESEILFLAMDGTQEWGQSGCPNRTTAILEDNNGNIWYGDEWNELRRSDGPHDPCIRFTTSTINGNSISEIAFEDNVVYGATGGVSEIFTVQANRDGFYILKDKDWSFINEQNHQGIRNSNFINFYTILPDPATDKLFIGSYGAGLMEYNTTTQESQFFTVDNSSLQKTLGDSHTTRVSGLAWDDGDLWISNFGAPEPISVFTADETWHSFNVPGSKYLAQVIVDQNGYKWFMIVGSAGGVLVYDDNGTVQNPTDDRPPRIISTGNSELNSNIVNCLAMDHNGDVWVGTIEGPVVFDCGGSVFESDCRGSKRLVLQDSIAAFLLETEEIKTIAIDGANRKWFGTRNGIFVQSPSGEEQIAHYSVDNSPLFDNNIIDMNFNDISGEMFISSEKGLQSIRTETLGSKVNRHEEPVYAFPNPVRPDYKGPIAIKGLARDADVKITDIGGKLIYETTALGGQAIWDGNDYNGQRAASGVYLVFSAGASSFDTPDSFVTKILIIN